MLGAACAGQPQAATPPPRPSDVLELSVLPPGYSARETLEAQCELVRGATRIEDEPLMDVDCSTERLSRVLRAQAARETSRLIVDRRCSLSGPKSASQDGAEHFSLSCSAKLAVADKSVPLSAAPAKTAGTTSGPAPSAAQVQDLDEPDPLQSREIRVSFAPIAAGARPAARRYDRVAETSVASVGRRPLGEVSARCDGCDPLALRHALRVTAGRMGAGEVAGVRCFEHDGSSRCVATALEPWSS